jgi:hypothetical protein
MKVIAIPSLNDREAYIQVSAWTRPEGGPWAPIKDKTTGAVHAWRHYYSVPAACEEKTGFVPPPEASISMDGGLTWSPLKGTDEAEWVTALKGDSYCKWHIRREGARLLARKAK